MKKYLLPEGGNFYKANLHCHTNVSDGRLSPEEVKKAYMEKGYSIVAYTDHDLLVPHPELADENFLPLNGYEMEADEKNDKEWKQKKTCHMCLIAVEPDNFKQVCYHRERYVFENTKKYRATAVFDKSKPDFVRDHTVELVSEMMTEGRKNGFFVTYNHPAWSTEDYNDYCNFENMHAMEICNYSCMVGGYPDYNESIYDDMLRSGKRIYCIAADDNHNTHLLDSRKCDSFGGFTMIKADKLEYRTITSALLAGNFYASQGPEIHELWFEDGRIHITCSKADSIRLMCGQRRAAAEYDEDGNGITSASFEVLPSDGYVRLVVTDKYGKHANTNAYFTDELF